MVAIMLGADNGFFYAGQVMHFSSPFTVFLIYHKQHERHWISKYSKLTIDAPCLEEQDAIANVISIIDKELALLQQDLEQEKQEKKALMQLLLTGIVRV